VTLTELLDRYALLMGLSPRSVELYAHTVEQFRRHLGRDPLVTDLEDVAVARFLRWRASTTRGCRTVSPATVQKDRSQLLALWTWSCKKKLHGGEWPGLPRAKKVRHTPVAYTAEEIASLIRLARTRRGPYGAVPAAWWWSTLLQVLWQSGERVGAAFALRWQEVDTSRGSILFRAATRKGGREDQVRSITPDLAAELEARRGPPEGLVWPRAGHPLSCYASLRILCERAGVRPRGFHAIRKSSASYVAAAGGDATAHLGHADPAMTRGHYLDPRITQTVAGLSFLPALDLTPRPTPPPVTPPAPPT
jgi:integrase